MQAGTEGLTTLGMCVGYAAAPSKSGSPMGAATLAEGRSDTTGRSDRLGRLRGGGGIAGGPGPFLGGERMAVMKLKSSLKSLKTKDGSVVVRRRGHTYVVNKRHPRWKARQG